MMGHTETFGDLGIVHLGIVLSDLATLETRPDHEGVHGSLDVVLVGLARGFAWLLRIERVGARVVQRTTNGMVPGLRDW